MSALETAPVRTPVPAMLRSAHLIGIGGSGMFPLAQALLAEGITVSGSDLEVGKSAVLRELGATVCEGHAAANLADPEVVVISTAIPGDNPELASALARGIPVAHRSEMLAWFLARRESVLVAGTHGKTTSTSLMGLLLAAAGADPWCFVGGRVREFGGNFRPGGERFAIAEADESDGSFLNLPRQHVLLTNIEPEHMNYWLTEDRLYGGFRAFVEALPPHGRFVACLDDPGVRRLLGETARPAITWTLQDRAGADYRATDVELTGESVAFVLWHGATRLGRFGASVPGLHNASNLAGCVAMAHSLGFDAAGLMDATRNFRGADRRFTRTVAQSGFLVVDDYAHHPTEIEATMIAARRLADERGGRVFAVFQPHRYTRIAALIDDFGSCFTGADHLTVLDIYPGGETPIPGVTTAALMERISSRYDGLFPVHATGLEDAKKIVSPLLKVDDIVLLLGAGSVTKLATLLASC